MSNKIQPNKIMDFLIFLGVILNYLAYKKSRGRNLLVLGLSLFALGWLAYRLIFVYKILE